MQVKTNLFFSLFFYISNKKIVFYLSQAKDEKIHFKKYVSFFTSVFKTL